MPFGFAQGRLGRHTPIRMIFQRKVAGKPHYSPGSVSEELLNSAQQPAPQTGRLALLSRFSDSISDVLDGFSFLFFCLPFSSLTCLLTSWCSRFLAEE
jgi:hypothetical protein